MNRHNVLGAALVLLGLLFLNNWFLEPFVPDGTIGGLPLTLNIALCQLFLYLVGIALVGWQARKKRLIALVASVLLLSSIYNGLTLYQALTADTEIATPWSPREMSSDQEALARALHFAEGGTATLSMETAELLYNFHETSDTIRVLVPKNGILDTATGVDPLITQMFSGTMFFRVSALLPNGKSRSLHTHRVEVTPDSEDSFLWKHVSVDLSEFSGRELELTFEKGIRDPATPPREVFDLAPEDLAFWRRPQVRSKALSGRLNVVLVSLDTLRADHLHYAGYRRETSPNLDTFSSEGTSFTQSVSQAPWTTPSHFSILTSTYPSTHRANQPVQSANRVIQSHLPTMAEIFRDHGYLTAAFTGSGSISAPFGFHRGFDFYNETPGGLRGHDVDTIVAKSVDWIKKNADRSFFLFFHTYEPHHPYTENFFVEQENILPSDEIAFRTARYDGDIRRTDAFFGELVQAFRDTHVLERTLFVVTSDHGEDLGGRTPKDARMQYGHGHNLYDELLRVPLIFRGPGVPAGKSVGHQVRSIDILPTVLELVGLPREEHFQGASLADMLGSEDRESRPAYSEATTFGTERKSIRALGYKYVHRASYGQLADPMSVGLLLTPVHELYNLETDPDERTNIAADNPATVTQLRDLIRETVPSIDLPLEEGSYLNIRDDEELMKNLRALGYVQ